MMSDLATEVPAASNASASDPRSAAGNATSNGVTANALAAKRLTRGRTRLTVPRHGRWPLVFAIVWLVMIALAAVFASVLPLQDPAALIDMPRRSVSLSFHEPLGTDALGRSQLSRLIYGARVSIVVGLAAASIAMVIGLVLGILGGYFRGRVEWCFNFVMNVLMSFPPLVLLLAIAAVTEPSLPNLSATLALLALPTFARVARASTLSYRQREFVDAAFVLGASHWRVMRRELIPNVLMPVLAITFIAVANLIVAEASLSFLGLGVRSPTPSWGGMMAAGRIDFQNDPQLVLVPAAALFFTAFSLNVLGDRLRRRTDGRGNQS